MNSVSSIKNDYPNIHNLLYSIYGPFQIPVKLITPDSRTVSVSDPDSLCNSFYCRASHADTFKKCRQSRSFLLDGLKSEEFAQISCLNGFSEIAFPVRTGGRLICVISLCGFLFDDELDRRNEMFFNSMKHGFDSRKFYDALMRSPVIKRSDIGPVIEKCASLVNNIKDALDQGPVTQELYGASEKKLIEAVEKSLSIKNSITGLETGSISPKPSALNKEQGSAFFENSLKESLELYRAIFEYSVDGIALADAETGIIMDCNRSFLNLMECEDKGYVVGKHQKTIHPQKEGAENFTVGFETGRNLITDKKPVRRQIISKTGIIKEVEITAGAFMVNGKKYIQGIFRDLTEEIKQAEKILTESEMKLKKMFASINDAVIISDLSGNILEINEYACKKLKYEKEELLKMTVRDINARYHRHETGERLKSVIKSGKTVYESHYMTKDAKIFPVEIKASLTEFNGASAMIAIVRDISERVNIENALLESEKRYHELVEISSEGFWVVGNNGDTIYLNQQMVDMVGYTIGEIGNRNICEFVHEDSISSFQDNFSKMTQGSMKQHEAILRHKNGKKIFVKISASFLTDREGNTTGRFALVTDITEKVELEKQFELVKKEISKSYTLGDIVGKSEYIRSIFEVLPSVSECDSNILIEGASGTGKSLIARTVHNLSSRRDGPFIVINCGALPEALLESELFGYTRGAFTDAKKDKPGKFMMADNGTIFLDEIGELPLHLQVKLLRVIEEKCVEPLGSNKTLKVNFRLIAATNRNLKTLVSEGRFREDLYYRLRVVYFNIPPLRERREDLELLADNFIAQLNARYNKNINEISGEVHTILKCHDFPGNARELYNMLEYAYILCKSGKINLSELPEEYAAFYKQITGKNDECETGRKEVKGDSEIKRREVKVDDETAHKDINDCDETYSEDNGSGYEKKIKISGISRESLLEILMKNKFNKNKTAKALNTSRVTLWRLMKKVNIAD